MDQARELIERIIDREQGYWDDPLGGETNFGITYPSWQEYQTMRGKSASLQQLRELTKEDAVLFYRWWFDKLEIDLLLAAGVSIDVCDLYFDCCVHHGPERAARWLQTIAKVVVDGKVGPKTVAAVAALPSRFVYKELLTIRTHFMVDFIAGGFIRKTKNPQYNFTSKDLATLNMRKGLMNRVLKFI